MAGKFTGGPFAGGGEAGSHSGQFLGQLIGSDAPGLAHGARLSLGLHRGRLVGQLLLGERGDLPVLLGLQGRVVLRVGRRDVLVTNWDPRRGHFDRYRADDAPVDPALEARCREDALKLNRALGYDMNTVEFAVRNGTPIAIDFTNAAPDFDISSLKDKYFAWVVAKMADLVIERVKQGPVTPTHRWDHFLPTGAGA